MTTNEMIYEALTTDSRKRKARWQAELETLGYKISKNGGWFIENTETNKWIELSYNDNYLRTPNGYVRFGVVYSRKGFNRKNKPLNSINFEGILNSTRNNDNSYGWTNVEIIRQNLFDRKYHQNKLDNAMNEYQQKIDEITKEYQKALARAKNSYDFDIKYHTKGLAEANNTINKLLKRA